MQNSDDTLPTARTPVGLTNPWMTLKKNNVGDLPPTYIFFGGHERAEEEEQAEEIRDVVTRNVCSVLAGCVGGRERRSWRGVTGGRGGRRSF